MTTTSAVPADLAGYVDAAGDGTARLAVAATNLRDALDRLRTSEGRSEFLADVPEVDLDLTFLALRWDRLAGWLDGVARAFEAADGGDGPRTLDDAALDRSTGRLAVPEVEAAVTPDGRLILDVGVGDDQVVIADQGDRLQVSVNGTVSSYALDPDAEVVVRGGAGHDRIAAIGLAGAPPRGSWVLDGGSGGDLLSAGAGRALLRGGVGADELRGGRGDDRLLGGEGDDVVRGGGGDDRVIGSAGADQLDGDAGDDHVSAGAGEDLVYGGAGDDRLDGGIDRDHLDGGSGVDHVHGADGADIVSGGEGADTVDGGAGDDVAYAGPGHDLVTGGSGEDSLHLEPGDVVGDATDDDTVGRHVVDTAVADAIVVDVGGDEHLEGRIRSDLVTLASTRSGARLLDALRGHEVRIVESRVGDGHSDGVVGYDLTDDDAGFGPAGADRPPFSLSVSPLVALHHELIHAYDLRAGGGGVDGVYFGPDAHQNGRVRVDQDLDGTLTRSGFPDPHDRWEVVDADGDGVVSVEEVLAAGDEVIGDLNGDRVVDRHDGWAPNRERDTVGLPVDHDQDPSTPDVPGSEAGGHPAWMSENALRAELGLELRGRY
jgi:hypothetical protein